MYYAVLEYGLRSLVYVAVPCTTELARSTTRDDLYLPVVSVRVDAGHMLALYCLHFVVQNHVQSTRKGYTLPVDATTVHAGLCTLL